MLGLSYPCRVFSCPRDSTENGLRSHCCDSVQANKMQEEICWGGSSHENHNWRSPRTARTSLRSQQRRLGQGNQSNRVGPADQAIEAKPYIQKASTLQTMGSDQFHDYLFTYNKSILTNTCLYCKTHIRKWDHIIDSVWQVAFFTKSYILNIFPCENIKPCFAILNVGWCFLKGKHQSFSFLLQNNI